MFSRYVAQPVSGANQCTCIIPFFNERDRILRVLNVATRLGRVREVICVDDGSTDGAAALVAQHYPNVTLVRQPHNTGKAAAVQAGVNLTVTSHVLLLDADLCDLRASEVNLAVATALTNPAIDMIILRRVRAAPPAQALEDVALMRGVPGMQVFCPADEADLAIGLPHVLASPQPVYIRHNPLPPAVEHTAGFEIGRAELVCDGYDVAILTYGALFAQVWQAAQTLQASGFSPRVLNLRTLKPIDEEAVIAAAVETRLLITVEDHFLSGGLGSIIAEILVRYRLSTPLLPIALHDRWFRPALLSDVLASEGFTSQHLADAILACLRPDGYPL